MVLRNIADHDLLGLLLLLVKDLNVPSKNLLSHPRPIGVVKEHSMPDITKVCLVLVDPFVNRQIVLGLSTEVSSGGLSMYVTLCHVEESSTPSVDTSRGRTNRLCPSDVVLLSRLGSLLGGVRPR